MSRAFRAPKPRPADKIAADFIRAHLGRGAFAPLTGTDWRAWHAFVHLVELWGVSRDGRAIVAMAHCVACAQTWHEDVMQVFVQTIPAMLDWCDVGVLWPQIASMVAPLSARALPQLADLGAVHG